MNLALDGTVALVAGSSRGIGRAIAAAFLREGASVLVTGRDEERVTATVAELGSEFGPERVGGFAGDLGVPERAAASVALVHERFGRLDSVVLNVGTGSAPTGDRVGLDEWQRSFAANLWPGVCVVEAALESLVAAGRGSVVFVGSIAGLEDLGAPLPYASAKAAVAQYSNALASRVGRHRIRVNAVAPGNILTPGGTWAAKLDEDPQRWHDYVAREVALGRFGTAEEIADVVVFLASERAAFVTGACIVADGGQTRGR
jgi:3-oxoacyl-[acyl-carrier protein] reductase